MSVSSSDISTVPNDDDGDFQDTREIKCPIHGYIPVSKIITTIIDTPQFQRLRYLKQLGTSYYVWPGASHNRFEHALGVYHLANLMVRRLQLCQPDLAISDRDVRCVQVAGLCHDLGHGPFSHVWDNTFIPNAMTGSEPPWKHEDASEMMLDFLVQDNNINLKADEVRFIKDLIQGEKRHTVDHHPPEKDFLFEIVANKRNGVDVDKFDYIARDGRAVGDGTTTDLSRLVHTARVIDGQVCYSAKNTMTVYSLFAERFRLHKMIYNHKTAKSIEYMIVDALLKADPVMKISTRIHDPKKFMHLTDEILLEVERSESPDLEEARNIIRRIRNRDLYRMVDKLYLPWGSRTSCRKHFTPERILESARCLPIDSLLAHESEEKRMEIKYLISNLREDHIIVDIASVHHGMGDKFPLDNCKFYSKHEPNKASPPDRADISHLLPSSFGELLIRVFTRDSDYYGIIQHAARPLLSSISPTTGTTDMKKERCSTPELPKTTPSALTTQLSNASIMSSDTYSTMEHPSTPKTVNADNAGPPVGSTTTPHLSMTPRPNQYMTVSIGFTPKTPKTYTSKTRQEGDMTPKPQAGSNVKTRTSLLMQSSKKRDFSHVAEGELREAAEVIDVVKEEDNDTPTDIGKNKRNKTTTPLGNKKKKSRV